MLGEQLDGDGIAHGAGGDEQRRLFAGDLRGAALQTIDGGVFAVNIVAHFGFHHGAAHRGRRLGDGIAAKIDHAVRNSWNTSFESITPRLVRRRMPPAVSSRPASMKRWMGPANRSHSAGSGRMPS